MDILLPPPIRTNAYVPCDGGPTYQHVVGYGCDSGQRDQLLLGSVTFDPTWYPVGARVRFETRAVYLRNAGTFCMRLNDLTLGTPVAGSEICDTFADSASHFVARKKNTGTLLFPPGAHEYFVEVKASTTGVMAGQLFAARFLIDWS